jgi:hypothetical protein
VRGGGRERALHRAGSALMFPQSATAESRVVLTSATGQKAVLDANCMRQLRRPMAIAALAFAVFYRHACCTRGKPHACMEPHDVTRI